MSQAKRRVITESASVEETARKGFYSKPETFQVNDKTLQRLVSEQGCKNPYFADETDPQTGTYISPASRVSRSIRALSGLSMMIELSDHDTLDGKEIAAMLEIVRDELTRAHAPLDKAHMEIYGR